MPADGFFNAMLGLFMFFICPFLIIRYIDKKLRKKTRSWSEKRRKEKVKREKKRSLSNMRI